MPVWYKSLNEFLQDLDWSMAEMDRYLADRKAGKPGQGTIVQLETLSQYLQTVSQNVRSGKMPPKPVRHSQSMAWILVDSWDYADPLGLKVMRVNSHYLNEL
jgi:hypothetical protein